MNQQRPRPIHGERFHIRTWDSLSKDHCTESYEDQNLRPLYTVEPTTMGDRRGPEEAARITEPLSNNSPWSPRTWRGVGGG